jgi:hypothetical protein
LGAAADTLLPNDARRDVDLVIALDVSGSMEGLIESAKQRLWDITNELARARPVPALRVAILSYGNPAYGEQAGYVRVDLPFTGDLDAVNATLFAFRTDGGDEYVARAIQTSLDTLQWSPKRDALRIVFVAGNISRVIGRYQQTKDDDELGPIEYIITAPNKHRNHHAKNIEQGNSNKGGQEVHWDHLFGTY